MSAITLEADKVLHNKYGTYRHNDIIGKKWGSRVRSSDPKNDGFLTLLHPTPELWYIVKQFLIAI
jgi:tRNA (adenine57-N1/adenine58-N1)-methyltransferase catalytic subunit